MTLLHTGPFGVNTYIVHLCGPYVFVVDPASCALCGDEAKVSSYLTQNNLIPVAFVLTHGHFDHVAGLTHLKKCFPFCPILINKNDSFYLGSSSYSFHAESLSLMGLEELLPAYENLPEADAFLENNKTLLDSLSFKKIESEELRDPLLKWSVLYTPGHTKGSVCLYNKEDKILISGDTVFFHSWGRTDLPGGSEDEIMRSLNFIYETLPKDTLVFSGHDVTSFLLGENC